MISAEARALQVLKQKGVGVIGGSEIKLILKFLQQQRWSDSKSSAK